MVAMMNEYIANINLVCDDITRGILHAALADYEDIIKNSVLIRGNHYLVDIKLANFSVESAVEVMGSFMERTRYPYSAFFVRFNEGNRVRYRYATCKENREGFYCDLVIS